MTKSILISGWRGIPHSYAMVNQYQCLELQRREDVQLYFEDRPFADPTWQKVSGIFSEDEEIAIAGIPPCPDGVVPDAELRIAFPFDLVSPPRAACTAVFGTSEYKAVPPAHVAHKTPLERAHRLHDGSMMIVTPSEWSREGFVRSGADARRVAVIPHGVDPTSFRPPTTIERSNAREKYKVGEKEFVFLNVGAMTGNKKVEMILNGFASVLRTKPTAKLVLKGMDALYPSKKMFMTTALQTLSAEDAQLALPRVVYIGGSLASHEMRHLYHAADCYVSPYSAEGFNLPVLEAAACGLPSICTGGGPTDEFTTEDFTMRIRSEAVSNELDGEVATSLRPDQAHLIRLMNRIVDDDDFRTTAREAAPAHVNAHFTWRHAVDKLLALFFPL